MHVYVHSNYYQENSIRPTVVYLIDQLAAARLQKI